MLVFRPFMTTDRLTFLNCMAPLEEAYRAAQGEKIAAPAGAPEPLCGELSEVLEMRAG